MLEIVFPEYTVELLYDNTDGYVFYIYKGKTDEERLNSFTFKFILKDISDEIRNNIEKRKISI